MDVELINRQQRVPLDEESLVRAVRHVLAKEGVQSGSVSIAVVDDQEMRELNRQYLQHDWSTDVLSFTFAWDGAHLDGELILGADTGSRVAAGYHGAAADELAWYAVHGALHLVGYDDQEPNDRQRMRAAERSYLLDLGLTIPPMEEMDQRTPAPQLSSLEEPEPHLEC